MRTLSELSNTFFQRKIDKPQSEIDCLKRTLSKFCESGKKEDAFSVYFCFCEIFKVFGGGYDSMGKLLEFLSDHEYHSGELLGKHRDHYAHSVYVFALGLAIYANDQKFNGIISNFYKNDNFNDAEFLYLWGLTALFHDIGYPFQLAHEQIKAYVGELWGEDNINNPYVSYDNMTSLLKLNDTIREECRFDGVDTIDDLLAAGISYRLGYPLDIVLGLLRERYAKQRRYMDHGYFSAILLANRLMQANVAVTDLKLDILTAIALHNSLNRYDISAKLNMPTPIKPEKHPFAYLLILCDELQNWDRTAFGYISKKDPLAWKIELDISNNSLKINYIFDSFTLIEHEEKRIDCVGSNKTRIVLDQKERINSNVLDLQNDKFKKSIYELIECHTTIFADAEEVKKEKKIKVFASSDKFVNLCDFAVAIHNAYCAQEEENGNNCKKFDELNMEYKLSNIEQAKSYADKLELINCFYSDRELDYPVVKGFSSEADGKNESGIRDELGFLAREEHLRWVREKLETGWKYGKDYNTNEERDIKKMHKDIIPYDCLPESEKKKNELAIKNMVPFLYKYGHGVRIYSYRTGLKPTLDIAGCGHRTISMKNERIKEEIKNILREYQKKYRVVVRTNFAYGADQLIAQCANELGITIKATIPFEFEEYIRRIRDDSIKYKYKFGEEEESNMRHLLAQTVSLSVEPDSQYTYLEASKYIINKSKKLIALWDGVETILEDEKGNPINQGGTWHNICIAKNSRGLKEEDIHIIKCER